MLSFYDKGLKLPRIRTIIYIGQNIFNNEEKGKETWYFQDAEAYLTQGVPKKLSEAEEFGVLAMGKDALPLICSLEGLIETLNDVKEDKLRMKHKI
jgi:hypothetical protein